MAAKTANVLARVEPDVKEQAEAIMAKLGVPASTAINILYKQIIMTRSIAFALSVPSTPIADNYIDTAAVDIMIVDGLSQAKVGQGLTVDEVVKQLAK